MVQYPTGAVKCQEGESMRNTRIRIDEEQARALDAAALVLSQGDYRTDRSKLARIAVRRQLSRLADENRFVADQFRLMGYDWQAPGGGS
jgi:hypothetical protein